MIDTSKQYTYNGKPVRIYADGRDCSLGLIHGAYQKNESGTWYCEEFNESDLKEAWEPKEGEPTYEWLHYNSQGNVFWYTIDEAKNHNGALPLFVAHETKRERK